MESSKPHFSNITFISLMRKGVVTLTLLGDHIYRWYIYIYTHTHVHYVYIYIYVYIDRAGWAVFETLRYCIESCMLDAWESQFMDDSGDDDDDDHGGVLLSTSIIDGILHL